jgi:hypothetical protein
MNSFTGRGTADLIRPFNERSTRSARGVMTKSSHSGPVRAGD